MRDSSHLRTLSPFNHGDFSFENKNPNTKLPPTSRLETEPNEARRYNADLELTEPSMQKPRVKGVAESFANKDRRSSHQELNGLINIMRG